MKQPPKEVTNFLNPLKEDAQIILDLLPNVGMGIHASRRKWHDSIQNTGLVNADSAVFGIHPGYVKALSVDAFAKKLVFTVAIALYHGFSLAILSELRRLDIGSFGTLFRENQDRLPVLYIVQSPSENYFKIIAEKGDKYISTISTFSETSFPYGTVQEVGVVPAHSIEEVPLVIAPDMIEDCIRNNLAIFVTAEDLWVQFDVPRFFRKQNIPPDTVRLNSNKFNIDISLMQLCFSLVHKYLFAAFAERMKSYENT